MFRYAALYFVMLVIFVALIAGPLVAGKKIPSSAFTALKQYALVQPTGLNNDDTIGSVQTGTGAANYTGWGTHTRTSSGSDAGVTTSAGNAKIRLF